MDIRPPENITEEGQNLVHVWYVQTREGILQAGFSVFRPLKEKIGRPLKEKIGELCVEEVVMDFKELYGRQRYWNSSMSDAEVVPSTRLRLSGRTSKALDYSLLTKIIHQPTPTSESSWRSPCYQQSTFLQSFTTSLMMLYTPTGGTSKLHTGPMDYHQVFFHQQHRQHFSKLPGPTTTVKGGNGP